MKKLWILLLSGTFGYGYTQEQETPVSKTGDAQFFMGVLLDQITTVGTLKACPSREDPKKYYYLPNKVRIATDDATGKPKFSFVRYVTNQRSTTEDTDIKEGGGIVHFLMGLSVSAEEIRTAESELQRKVSGAKLVGPVIYRSGTVSLIVKSSDSTQEIQVLGTGPAPILDGDVLAVGFTLNAKDAAILWETFRSPTPQVSLNFSMQLAGLNSPIGTKMKVNWNALKKHRLMNLDLDVPIFKGEISDMVTELKQHGVIEASTVGNDADQQRLINKITDKIVALCFDPVPTDSVANTGRAKNYVIDKVAAKAKQDDIRARQNTERQEFTAEKPTADAAVTSAEANALTAKNDLTALEDQEMQAKIDQKTEDITKSEEEVNKAEGELKLAKEKLKDTTIVDKVALQKAIDSTQNELTAKKTNLKTAKDAKKNLEEEKKRLAKAHLQGAVNKADQTLTQAKGKAENIQDEIEARRGITLADFSVQAVYHRAKVIRSIALDIDLKKYDPVVINETFGGNVGRINCRECLMEVNTASHLYTQRELIARLDGQAAQNDNFGKYINYVTVRIRKKHGAGDLTYDEVRIDRKNFNKEGNFFKMLYGWRAGDNDRRNWLNYDYQTSWSFFGGYTINENWKPANNQAIALSPPFQRSEIRIMAEAEPLIKASVRAVFLKIYYKMGETEYVKRVTVNPKSDLLEQVVDVMHTQGDLSYDYEMDWVLTDGSILKSGRKTTTNEVIFADILPNK